MGFLLFFSSFFFIENILWVLRVVSVAPPNLGILDNGNSLGKNHKKSNGNQAT